MIELFNDGGHSVVRVMMIIDTRSKEIVVSFEFGGRIIHIGGVVKGSGMIHFNMVIMLVFIIIDVAVELDFFKSTLIEVLNKLFNMLSVDGDISINDFVLVLVNGLVGNMFISVSFFDNIIFEEALVEVCIYLICELARDGEGAFRLIVVEVGGVAS